MSVEQKSTSSSFIFLLLALLGISAVVLSLRNTFIKQSATDAGSAFCVVKKVPVTQFDTTSIVRRLSELITVPSGTPTIAVIEDVEKLKKENPAFYQEAQQGDRVISWPTKVVLYSTSKDVVLVALPVRDMLRTD